MLYLEDINLPIRGPLSTSSDVRIRLLDPAFRPQLALVSFLPKEY